MQLREVTMRHDGFLQDIIEHPDDDTPRLIYADWLHDHGQPDRAEFIRLQVQLARQGHEVEDYLDLVWRVRQLFLQHEEAWAAEQSAYPGFCWGRGRPWSATKVGVDDFERGFLRWATVEDTPAFLRRASEVLTGTTVQGLSYRLPEGVWERDSQWVSVTVHRDTWPDALKLLLSSPLLRSFSALSIVPNHNARLHLEGCRLLAGCPHLAGLRALSLANQGVGDEGVADLSASPYLAGLTRLDLQGNGLKSASLRALASSPYLRHLRELDLSGAHFEDGGSHGFDADGLGALATSPIAPQLRVLSLRWTRLVATDVGPLTEGPGLSQLRVLDLSQNALDAAAVRSLLGSPVLAGLRELHLGMNSLGPEGATEVARAACLGGLRTLGLGWTGLSPKALWELAEAPALAGVRNLDVGFNPLGDEGVMALTRSAIFGRLVALNLTSVTDHNSAGPLTGEGVRALAGANSLASLRELTLGRNNLDSQALGTLATSPHLSELRRFSLWGARVGDGGVQTLAASPLARRLTELELRDNSIGPEGAACFLDRNAWPNLLRLDLQSNPVGSAAAQALRRCWGQRVVLDEAEEGTRA
jgi:uncharacterized protein (TIGR02996 family)